MRAFQRRHVVTLTDAIEVARAAEIGKIELRLGIEPREKNKGERATAIGYQLLSSTHSDELVAWIATFLMTDSRDAPAHVQDPRIQQMSSLLRTLGFVEVERRWQPPTSSPTLGVDRDQAMRSVTGALAEFQRVWPASPSRVTDENSTQIEGLQMDRQDLKVFVVYGRDEDAHAVLIQFLRHIGLRPMEWDEAAEATGKTTPTTYEIVKAGMERAAAIVVLFTPDDMGHLRKELTPSGEKVEEPSGQARQNVTLEAGMAYGMSPNRTIFVRSVGEPLRGISDLDGFNVVKLDGKPASRRDLRNRLKMAGAHVDERVELEVEAAGTFLVDRH